MEGLIIEISILCPTRNRPQQLELMISSAISLAKNPEKIEFCVWIDSDDSSYDDFLVKNRHINLSVYRGSRVLLCSAWNALASFAKGDFLMWLGDDSVFLTQNWDSLLTEKVIEFPDNLGLAYVNDLGDYEQKWANIGMVHKNWVNTFGFLFSPHMRDNGIDGWITDVAKRINRLAYLDYVKVEHRQHRQKKSLYDDTYKFRDITNKWNDVQGLYRLLKDERRRESLFLAYRWPGINIRPELRYVLSSFYMSIIKKIKPLDEVSSIYYRSISNKAFIFRVLAKMFKKKYYQW